MVLATYQQFYERGLGIFGISHGTDREALLSTVKKKGIAWSQYFDGKATNSDVALRYGVRSIPGLWLIDTVGRVVATGVRADQLATLIPPLLPSAATAR